MIATPIAAAMMSKSAWTPFLLSSVVSFVGLGLGLLLPETLYMATQKQHSQAGEVEEDETSKASVLSQMINQSKAAAKSASFIWKDYRIMLLLFAFLVSTLGRQAMSLLLIYMSTKFNWTIASVSFNNCSLSITKSYLSRLAIL
jgi:hypothetical protein